MPDRPSFRETCACGSIYVAGIPDAKVLEKWRDAHEGCEDR